MSALAARRAALAAKAAFTAEAPPAPTTPTTRSKKAAKPAPPAPPSPTLSDFSGVSDESDDSAGPSNKRRKVANKKGKKPTEKKDKEARYFVGVEIPTRAPQQQPRKKRAFSPSAAVEELDDEASGESSGEEEVDPVQPEDAEPWSGAPSPWEPRAQTASSVVPCSSFFEVEKGVNFATVTKKQLSQAGITSTGPGVVISIRVQETLAIAGTYTITPLLGSLSLLSTTLVPSEDIVSHPVFAPTSHPLPILARANDEQLESELLEALPLPKTFDLGASQTVFLLQENRTGIEGLRGDVVPGFNNIWLGEQGAWGLRGVHPVFENFAVPVYPHVTPASWTLALSALASGADAEGSDSDSDGEGAGPARPPVVLVKGPKRSGKSALARAALNALLGAHERVAWLECDLGQGEFSAGGAVGLWVLERPVLGPSFTHPAVPLRAQYLGELSPAACPDEYMGAVHALLAHYAYEVAHPSALLGAAPAGAGGRRADVPLVVNTQGWVRGLGEELLRGIEAAAGASHVFAFAAEVPPEREGWTASPEHLAMDLPFAAPWDPAHAHAHAHAGGAPAPAHFAVEPAPASPLQARYSAADLRALATVAYLHARPGGGWDFGGPLLAARPWAVQLGAGGALRAAYLAGEGAGAVAAADLPRALNGSLVGLLAAPAEPAEPGLEAPDVEVYVPGRAPPGAEDATFLGVALVRAVRVAEDEGALALQLVTPLAPAELARATALVRNGALALPTCGLLDWRARVPGGGVSEDGLAGVRWDAVPFFDAAGAQAAGAERRRVRRNIMRKGQ